MIFTSYEFLLCLPVLFLVYYLVPKKLQWMLLLAFSIFLYAAADCRYLIYIAITIITTYVLTVRIEKMAAASAVYIADHKEKLSKDEKKAYKSREKAKRFRMLLLCLVLNFGILAVIKYSNFTIYNINSLLHFIGVKASVSSVDFLLPLGISFYTFQTMGYAIDIYRGQYPAEKNPFRLALFVSFFPQLIQGPISRFGDLSKTLYSEHRFDVQQISFGLQRIVWGYFKKLVIADRILIAVTKLIHDTESYRGIFVLVGMLFYALELYADFTGGIDITIGIAQVLGIRVKENFCRPYFSKGIKEYWNRWHISLGAWFTEYVFYPVSVCRPMLRFSRFSRRKMGEQVGKRLPVYFASILVWFITGFWHGASWNFIVWGLGNCFFILLSQELSGFYKWFHLRVDTTDSLWFKCFQVVRTVLLMSCLRMFDCYRDVPLTFRMFSTMFTNLNVHRLFDGTLLKLGLTITDYIVLFFGTGVLFAVSMIQRKGSVRERIHEKKFAVRMAVWYGLFLAVLLLGIYGIGYDSSQFIYNQF